MLVTRGRDYAFWVAVQELSLNYHNVDISEIKWFLDFNNLVKLPDSNPVFTTIELQYG